MRSLDRLVFVICFRITHKDEIHLITIVCVPLIVLLDETQIAARSGLIWEQEDNIKTFKRALTRVRFFPIYLIVDFMVNENMVVMF